MPFDMAPCHAQVSSPALTSKQNNSFFFADERSANGGISAPPKGESYAKFFLSLTEDEDIPSYATFVDGEYREFSL